MIPKHPSWDELAKAPPFLHLEPTERSKIRERLTVVTIPANRFLLRQGNEGTDLFFLIRGRMKISRFHKGKEVILAIRNEGAIIGEIAALCTGARTADVVAITDATLFKSTKEDFLWMLSQGGELPALLMKDLARCVHAASNRLADLALFDVTGRLVRLLSAMATPTLRDGIEVQIVRDPPTHQVLASMIGSSRETVTRALRELEQAAQMTVEGDSLVLNVGGISHDR